MPRSNEPKPLVKNAVRCGICGAPADRYYQYYECQKNPCHLGDCFVGIFSDLTPPESFRRRNVRRVLFL